MDCGGTPHMGNATSWSCSGATCTPDSHVASVAYFATGFKKKKVYSCSRKTVHHLSSMDCPRNCTHFMNWTMLHTLSRGHRYNMLFHAVPSSGIGANHQTLAGPSCDRQTFLGRPRGVLAAPLREFFARSTQRDQWWRSRPWKIRKTAMCILIHHVCHRYQHPKISNY